MKPIEQVVRDILTQAVKDGLVQPADPSRCFDKDTDPQGFSSGELVGCANVLADYCREFRDCGQAALSGMPPGWQAALGIAITPAERGV